MKTLFACAFALAVTTAASGWADRAAADEPFELNAAQLDGVTAGVALLLPAVQAAREAARSDNATEGRYLSNWDAGLILLDVSDPANPVANPTPPGLPELSSPR